MEDNFCRDSANDARDYEVFMMFVDRRAEIKELNERYN